MESRKLNACRVESLEDRSVPALTNAIFDPANGHLLVVGQDGNDVIQIYRNENILIVQDDQAGVIAALDYESVNFIELNAGFGDDVVAVAQDVETQVDAHGGAGNDTLFAGGGVGVYKGDFGDDTLWGGNGRCILIGGFGSDNIWVGTGGAIAIHGWTDHDNDVQTMDKIATVWAFTDVSYENRIDTIRNGKDGVPALNADTVHDDDGYDDFFYTNSEAQNWAFAFLPDDEIFDAPEGEVIN